jgi:hypothetical protein
VHDTPEADLSTHFTACFGFIAEALAAGGGVLIHCFAGRSRSVTVLTAFLMRQQHLTLQVRWRAAAGGCARDAPTPARAPRRVATRAPRRAALFLHTSRAAARARAPTRRGALRNSPAHRRATWCQHQHVSATPPRLHHSCAAAHAPLLRARGAQGALALVHAVRPFACPNSGFMRQLQARPPSLLLCCRVVTRARAPPPLLTLICFSRTCTPFAPLPRRVTPPRR